MVTKAKRPPLDHTTIWRPIRVPMPVTCKGCGQQVDLTRTIRVGQMLIEGPWLSSSLHGFFCSLDCLTRTIRAVARKAGRYEP